MAAAVLRLSIPSSSSSADPSEPSSRTFQRLKSSLEQSLRTATRSKKPPVVDEFAAFQRTVSKGKEKANNDEPEKLNMLKRVTFRRQNRDSATPSPVPPADTRRVTGSMRQASMSSPTLPPSTPPRQISPPVPLAPSRHRPTKSSPVPTRTRRDLPDTPRASSPSAVRSRSPPAVPRSRVVTPTRAITSASTSNLPLAASPSPPPTPTRRRPSTAQHRPSDAARRPSLDATRRTPSPSTPIRPRPVSPTQRAYAQNRHFNVSSGDLVISNATPLPKPNTSRILSDPGASSRDLVRTATSLILTQVQKPPSHLSRTDQRSKDWDEVNVRTRSLIKLDRGPPNGLDLEERERKLFCDALRDGYVLCQLMNKLRSSSIVRPDAREDGVVRTANITKFLASCASYGMPNDDLFLPDDLMESNPTKDAAVRVARTVIRLVGFGEEGEDGKTDRERGKWIRGGGLGKQREKDESAKEQGGRSPYGTLTSMSTPNLSTRHPPTSPTRKRWTPPEDMPPLRSNTPEEGSGSASGSTATWTRAPQDDADEGTEVSFKPVPVPTLRPPPPRSPLRKKSSMTLKIAEDTSGGLFAWARMAAAPGSQGQLSVTARDRDSMADSTRASMGDASIRDEMIWEAEASSHASGGSLQTDHLTHHQGQQQQQHRAHPSAPIHYPGHNHNINNHPTTRQSLAVSMAETETTMTSGVSSLLDGGGGRSPGWRDRRDSNGNNFGTIRTMTTDMTSEAPSVSRAEGSKLVEELEAAGVKRRVSSSSSLGGEGSASGHGKMYAHGRERKHSEAPMLDLSRVAEEVEESVSGHGHGQQHQLQAKSRTGRLRLQERSDSAPAVGLNLKKGKWPDDFFTASSSSSSLPCPTESPHHHHRDESHSSPSTPLSISPPRKLAIVGGAARRGEGLSDPSSPSSSSSGYAPRRPAHRPRHSLDAPLPSPALLPKESILRRDASPDSLSASVTASGRVVLRRHTTKQGAAVRRGVIEDAQADGLTMGDAPVPVPFPRSVSAEHGGTPSPRSSVSPADDGQGQQQQQQQRQRLLRGRFQSDVEGSSSSRHRPRPSSYDDDDVLRPKPPLRSRFESMVNLGVASSGTTSASDLMGRERDVGVGVNGSGVRMMRLVVREDGKPPTHFQLGNCIGRGQFGSVYRALNLNTGQMVAVKRIRLEGLKEEEVTTLMREVDLVKSLSHPSIVKYEGMARDEDTLSIVLEYAENGSLGQILKAFGKLNEKLVVSYVVKILEGLHYLHTSDVVHCDLKAANILTTKNGNVKLSDFGVSLNLRAMEREIKDVAGTPNWMAPEVIELKGASTKSDIWSLGCTVIELLTGRPPYADIANSMSVMFRIVEDDMPPLPEGFSELLIDFLEQCFNKDPTQRPSAELLCEHPWLKMNWVALKELQPQDSIPFLRRVSTDLHKTDVRYLAQLDIPESPVSASPKRDDPGMLSPIGRRTSTSSFRPIDNDFSPREHTFVKTTFSKPMVCRVCLLTVKKSAVLCSQCSLISHAKCAVNAPPTCDLRAQLLLYAQYAEKGNPTSVYSNPADALHDHGQNVAMSDVPFVEHKTTIDPPPRSPATPNSDHPPTAFKFMAAFRRSRTNLSSEPVPMPITASSSSSTPPSKDSDEGPARRRMPRRADRPLSVTSTSTGISSLRSAATAAESFSSRQNTGGRSHASSGEADKDKGRRPVSASAALDQTRPRMPAAAAAAAASSARSETTNDTDDRDPPSTGSLFPGSMPPDTRRPKKHKSKAASSSNCLVQ